MFEWKGTHTCEDPNCGKEYEWIARYRQPGEKMISGRVDDIISHNITNIFVSDEGHIIATGYCPYCGWLQARHFVDEPIENLE